MTRIILKELNKKLKREYKLRFFSVLMFCLSFVFIFNVFFVSPSYLLLYLYEKAYLLNDYSLGGEKKSKIFDDFNKKISQVYELAKKVPLKNQTIDTNIAQILFVYSEDLVDLESIELLPEDLTTKVSIRGFAETRDSLIQFQDIIRKDNRFTNFDIPIETLAKQKDLNFNIIFNYDEN